MTAIAPHTRRNARRLRAEMTPQEQRLWWQLRDLNRRLGTHFRRQAPTGSFIADFADLGRKLVIEVDGGQHGAESDAARDAWFAAQGFQVLRFRNPDVDGNIDGVMQMVLDVLEVAAFRAFDAPACACPMMGGSGGAVNAGREFSASASPPPRGEGLGVGGRPHDGGITT